MGRTLVSLLLCPALCMGVVSLTISHTSWVRFHPGRRITLPCTETTPTGMVQYWHTPFGRVQNSSFHFNQEDVVAMQQDGSLQIPSTSHQHHGLYYCLHLVGKHATLTPYMLITSGQRDHGYKPRRVVRSVLTGQAERDVPVSDLVFKSAVAASVVVTFLVGFSFGALSRTLLDRCINWVRSLGHRRRYHGETVRMVFRKDPKGDSASLTVVTMENTNSSPPAKPKRSFRGKQYNGNTVYLEGCDQEREVKERERRDCKERSEREVREWRDSKDSKEMSEREVRERRDSKERSEREGTLGGIDNEEGSRMKEKDKGHERSEESREMSVSEVSSSGDSEKGSAGVTEGGESREMSVSEVSSSGDSEKGSAGVTEGGESREMSVSEVSSSGDSEKGSAGVTEGGESREMSVSEVSSSGDSEKGSAGVTEGGEERPGQEGDQQSSVPQPAKRSCVIRLYQYDEEGHRYGHLPDPDPVDNCKPRPKQRSLSLTRLNAIMAAATASPLDPKSPQKHDPEQEDKDTPSPTDHQQRAVFQLGI